MKAVLALSALAGSAAAQAVTSLVVPSSTPPAGCENSVQGTFGLSVVNVTGTPSSPSPSRRNVNLEPRQASGTLKLNLNGGVMKDQDGRTAYVASNYQFQFDNPPQAGAIYTAGFGLCKNNSITIGGKALWYQCLSGTFYNLYDRDWAAHCNPVYFQAVGVSGQPFSAAPPQAEVTGPSEATIANGGGTQSMNATATASATGVTNGTASITGSGSMPTGNSSSGGSSSGGSGSGGSGGSGSSGSSKTSSGGAMALATEASQALFPLAMGIVGAIAMV